MRTAAASPPVVSWTALKTTAPLTALAVSAAMIPSSQSRESICGLRLRISRISETYAAGRKASQNASATDGNGATSRSDRKKVQHRLPPAHSASARPIMAHAARSARWRAARAKQSAAEPNRTPL